MGSYFLLVRVFILGCMLKLNTSIWQINYRWKKSQTFSACQKLDFLSSWQVCLCPLPGKLTGLYVMWRSLRLGASFLYSNSTRADCSSDQQVVLLVFLHFFVTNVQRRVQCGRGSDSGKDLTNEVWGCRISSWVWLCWASVLVGRLVDVMGVTPCGPLLWRVVAVMENLLGKRWALGF